MNITVTVLTLLRAVAAFGQTEPDSTGLAPVPASIAMPLPSSGCRRLAQENPQAPLIDSSICGMLRPANRPSTVRI
jgi:hypothetical protein